MPPTANRVGILAGGVTLFFAVVVAILLRVIPPPRRETDYLVIGGIATLVSMLALFFVLIATWLKSPDSIIKVKRRKP